MSSVLVSADDFCLHRDIDEGILSCIERGVVQSVSFSALGRRVSWDRLHALRQMGVRVDLHLTLVHERWYTSNCFIKNWRQLMIRIAGGGRRFALSMRAEVQWQIHQCLEHDLVPTHLDSHQHVHVLPILWPMCVELAGEHGIGRLRVPWCPSAQAMRSTASGVLLQMLALRRSSQVDAFLPCIGLARSGHNCLDTIESELQSAGGRDVELVAHPGVATPELLRQYGFWGYDWALVLSRS